MSTINKDFGDNYSGMIELKIRTVEKIRHFQQTKEALSPIKGPRYHRQLKLTTGPSLLITTLCTILHIMVKLTNHFQ